MRLLMGVSVYSIAQAIGHSRQYVSRVLRGVQTSQPVLDAAWDYLIQLQTEQEAA